MTEDRRITLTITQKQAELIKSADRAEKEAQSRKHAIVHAIVAGHDVPDGCHVEAIDGTSVVLVTPEDS